MVVIRFEKLLAHDTAHYSHRKRKEGNFLREALILPDHECWSLEMVL